METVTTQKIETQSIDIEQLKLESQRFIEVVDKLERQNEASQRGRENLEKTINELIKNNQDNKAALDISTHAIEILRSVSDEAVSKAYGFLEKSLNSALEKMFRNTTRKIQLKESIRGGQYPQLEIILHVKNNKVRSLKSDSGHGIAQIVSLLSILSLIVITGSRRIMVMDEILSGLSANNRKIVNDIMWSFTEIGFQFIVTEHGFIPKGSRVYHLEMVGEVSHISETYIEKNGVYLNMDTDTDDDEETEIEDEVNTEDGEENIVMETENDSVNNSGNSNNIKEENSKELNNQENIKNNIREDTGSTVLSI